jgi:hypothetical protein
MHQQHAVLPGQDVHRLVLGDAAGQKQEEVEGALGAHST